MCDQLQGDEIEVRAIRLQVLGLELDDRATAYLCQSPVFDEICDAVTNAIRSATAKRPPRIDYCSACRSGPFYVGPQPVRELRVGTVKMLLCRKHFEEELCRRTQKSLAAIAIASPVEAV